MHRAQQLLPWGQSLWHYGASLYGKAWNNNPETGRLQTLTKLHPISPGTVNFRDLNGSKTWWTILAEHPTTKLTYIAWVSGSYDLYDLWPYIPVWGIKHFGRIDYPSTAATTTLKIPLRPSIAQWYDVRACLRGLYGNRYTLCSHAPRRVTWERVQANALANSQYAMCWNLCWNCLGRTSYMSSCPCILAGLSHRITLHNHVDHV